MSRRCVMALVGVLIIVMATGAGSARAETLPALHDEQDVHVAAVHRKTDRLFELTLTTPLLTAPTNVDVLLPDGYDAHPHRRYPVLWLFHGTSGRASDWTTTGDAAATTAGRDMIVVMPDAGIDGNGGSWFTDWVNGGRFGAPMWETFHVGRLIPFVDTQLRTVPTRAGRAIAGLSQGGFGALSYAARHPDLFVAAASLSGALDIAADRPQAEPVIDPVILATEVGLDQVPPNTFFGDRVTNELNWAAHDPATLVGNLQGMRVFTYTGNGAPGPLDSTPVNPAAAGIEAGVHELTGLFDAAAQRKGIPVAASDYGPGTHSWPYWARDLRQLIGPLSATFAAHSAPPGVVDYQSADPQFSEWGWHVEADPARAPEFLEIRRASSSGLTLVGSGTTRVTMPTFFRGLRRVDVIGGSQAQAVPDRQGRIRFIARLGVPNRSKQYTAGANTPTTARTVRLAPHAIVRITRVRANARRVKVCARALGGRVAARVRLTRRAHRLATSRKVTFTSHAKCRTLRRTRRVHRTRAILRIAGRDGFGHQVTARRSVRLPPAR